MKVRKMLVLSALAAAVAMSAAACSSKTEDPTQAPATQAPATAAPTVAPTQVPAEEAPAPAPVAEFSGVDFSGGNIDFVRIDHTRKATDAGFSVELADFDGTPAAKIAPIGGKLPYIGISVDSLLSASDVAKVDTIALKLGLKSLDGEFWPLTAKVLTLTGEDLKETETTKIGIQSEVTNPKVVYSKLSDKFVAGANNFFLIVGSQDDGTGYKGKNEIYILGVGFRDADGNYLPTKADAGDFFPVGYDVSAEEIPTYEYALGEAPYAAGSWNNFGAGVPLEIWKSAKKIVVEFTPNEDGSNPLAGDPFVVQAVGGAGWFADAGWNEIKDDDINYEITGNSISLNLEGISDVTEVQNIGLGAWVGGEAITRIYLICEEAPKQYDLGSAPYAAGSWNNFGAEVPIEVWKSAKKLVVEYTPNEDGTNPLAGDPFVVQAVGGSGWYADAGWNEIKDDDLNYEDTGSSLILNLEGIADVTEVQNIGIGAWNGGEAITRIYLEYVPGPNKLDLGAAPYAAGSWNNFNSVDYPLEAWQKATKIVVEYTPNEDGSNPLAGDPFVVQAVGGSGWYADAGWNEIKDDDLNYEDTGSSLILNLEGIADVTEVQNIGIGAWNGGEAITRIYLETKYSAE
ncbi:hypothetical protein FACS189490_00560 [Clostridia bacterium]|nr:hypothetical protein FACS189490_00560 [Clostridia bacterium]